MKFIFPQNYHFKNKILGIIDYQTALVNVIWYTIVFLLVNLLFDSINIKIFVFISLCFPLLLLVLLVFMEKILYMFLDIYLNSFLGKNCFSTRKIIKI